MKLTKCSRNHFYDGDKYSECPHCNGAGIKLPATEKKASSSILGAHVVPSKQTVGKETPQTSSMWEKSHHQRNGVTEAVIPAAYVPINPEGVHQQAGTPLPASGEIGTNVSPSSVSPLQDAVNVAKSPPPAEDVKTMAFYNIDSAEPVVGWLVCVKGTYLGEGFNLKAGRNLIGRSLKMDIPLAKEPSISRDRHAIITYEPKKRKFYIQPGESNGLTYVNEELLMLPIELKSYDKVQIGSSEFVFCAFCGELFTWDDYI